MFASLGQADSSRALTGGVCYCCKTAIATDTSGGVYAAWRHVYEGNVRDIAFTKSSDGGRTFAPPVRVSDDNWVLDGCPENGPSMIVDADARVHVVWPTLVPGPTSTSEPTLSAVLCDVAGRSAVHGASSGYRRWASLAIRRSRVAATVSSSSRGTNRPTVRDESHWLAERSMRKALRDS